MTFHCLSMLMHHNLPVPEHAYLAFAVAWPLCLCLDMATLHVPEPAYLAFACTWPVPEHAHFAFSYSCLFACPWSLCFLSTNTLLGHDPFTFDLGCTVCLGLATYLFLSSNSLPELGHAHLGFAQAWILSIYLVCSLSMCLVMPINICHRDCL